MLSVLNKFSTSILFFVFLFFGLDVSANYQDQYIKDSLLIEYLTAMNPNDEAPWIGNMQLHPRPKWQYKHLMNKVDKDVLEQIEQKIKLLRDFNKGYLKIKEKHLNDINDLSKIEQELIYGLDVTALRAKHRAHTLSGEEARKIVPLSVRLLNAKKKRAHLL